MSISAIRFSRADSAYQHYLHVVQQGFERAVAGHSVVYTSDTSGEALWSLYLSEFAPEVRQQHNCRACRRFIEKFGGLVTVDDHGRTAPVFAWLLGSSVASTVSAKITGVFLTSELVWGIPHTGVWSHVSVDVSRDSRLVYQGRDGAEGAARKSAEKLQDYEMLQRALNRYPLSVAERAVSLLESDALYRSEKVLGIATWFRDLQLRLRELRGDHARAAYADSNTVWRAVASAPPGFCHINSSMIGTLLDDLVDGRTDYFARWTEKMHPLKYQRPTAPPKAGNIAQAERLVAELASAGALERRFARLEDLHLLYRHGHTRFGDQWRQKAKPIAPYYPGVFAHLRAPIRASTQLIEAPGPYTWVRFLRDVLPTAEEIEVQIPATRAAFIAYTTATRPNAPPILQWDRPECRNPVAWYQYYQGAFAHQFNLKPGFARVTGITELPPNWYDAPGHHGNGVSFILQDCRDNAGGGGLGLFPECLRAEYHPIRQTIEAYSQRGRLTGMHEATACGLDFRKGPTPPKYRLRVTSKNGALVTLMTLDRWE